MQDNDIEGIDYCRGCCSPIRSVGLAHRHQLVEGNPETFCGRETEPVEPNHRTPRTLAHGFSHECGDERDATMPKPSPTGHAGSLDSDGGAPL